MTVDDRLLDTTSAAILLRRHSLRCIADAGSDHRSPPPLKKNDLEDYNDNGEYAVSTSCNAAGDANITKRRQRACSTPAVDDSTSSQNDDSVGFLQFVDDQVSDTWDSAKAAMVGAERLLLYHELPKDWQENQYILSG